MKPTPSTERAGGFSLVEVTLALGIIAFALVGIMALFPVAMKSARESMEETKATLIARQIFADLKAGALEGQSSLVIGPNLATQTVPVDLRSASELAVGFDDEGMPAGGITAQNFENSIPADDLQFAVRVTVSPNTPDDGISRVTVLVTTPTGAALDHRTTFPFVQFLSNRQSQSLPEESP